MLKRTIPSTGESLPAIGLGTWQTFDVGDDPAQRDRLADVLETFVELGGTVVDSSPMYGRAERVVGDLAARLSLHGRLFLATKVWTSGRTAGITQMESSFEKMQSPRLDLMQVHNLVDVDAHLDTLEEWKAAGRVRYVGITHYQAGGHPALVEVMRARRLDFVGELLGRGNTGGRGGAAGGAGARHRGAGQSAVRRRKAAEATVGPTAAGVRARARLPVVA